jgi:hypothetical protein
MIYLYNYFLIKNNNNIYIYKVIKCPTKNKISIVDIREYNTFAHSDLEHYDSYVEIDDGNEEKIHFNEVDKYEFDITTSSNLETLYSLLQGETSSGGKKHSKKDILGKSRCIYKIKGYRKEYTKHKGKLITVKEYKSIIKTKASKPKNNPKRRFKKRVHNFIFL